MIALLNFVGTLLSVTRGTSDFFPSLSLQTILCRLLSSTSLPTLGYGLIAIALSFLMGVPFVFAWQFSKKGNRIALICGVVGYLVDFGLIFLLTQEIFWTQLFLHLVILVFLLFAVIDYESIVALAKKQERSRKDL